MIWATVLVAACADMALLDAAAAMARPCEEAILQLILPLLSFSTTRSQAKVTEQLNVSAFDGEGVDKLALKLGPSLNQI